MNELSLIIAVVVVVGFVIRVPLLELGGSVVT